MRWVRGVLGSGLVAALGCGDSAWVQVSPDLYGQQQPPRGLLQGDTVQLYAVEGHGSTEYDSRVAPDASRQDQFTWKSSDGSIVEIVSNGKLLAKGAGRAQIEVTRADATGVFFVWVYPPDAAIRLSPRDTAIALGQVVTVTRAVFHSGSTMLQDESSNEVTIRVNFNPANRVLEPLMGTSGNGWVGNAKGTAYIHAFIELYKRPSIRDSILVTVR